RAPPVHRPQYLFGSRPPGPHGFFLAIWIIQQRSYGGRAENYSVLWEPHLCSRLCRCPPSPKRNLSMLSSTSWRRKGYSRSEERRVGKEGSVRGNTVLLMI